MTSFDPLGDHGNTDCFHVRSLHCERIQHDSSESLMAHALGCNAAGEPDGQDVYEQVVLLLVVYGLVEYELVDDALRAGTPVASTFHTVQLRRLPSD